ncbi:MAG: thiamine pyrophosphate-dependent enzyme [Anaerolineales bacterium]|nr:thiamine pyrophosphate-dependent enzyme [Anaerolineales bacterium]
MVKVVKPSLPLPPVDILHDYRIAYRSRQVSLVGRREVLSGKAKFGIFGDGKEVPQVALARAFRKGDWRSGYYRDQTWVMALGVLDVQAYFAQLYAHADLEADPATAGRSMVGHFVSRYINPDGSWKDQTELYNIAADVSPTAAQMPRLVGLAYASVLYRHLDELKPHAARFSRNGDEVAWATIGNASTAEGMFWEAVNAIGVLKAPAVISIFDDGYGISVPNQFQMVKENIYAILKGFEREPCPAEQCDRGYDLYTVPAWDYRALLVTYQAAAETARRYHIPSLVHVTDVTQPLGHSTSGSHERYKPPERLAWEAEWDCIKKFREWILENGIADEAVLTKLEEEEKQYVEQARRRAWEAYRAPLENERKQVLFWIGKMAMTSLHRVELESVRARLESEVNPTRREIVAAAHEALVLTRGETSSARQALVSWRVDLERQQDDRYHSFLYSPLSDSALAVPEVKPVYAPDAPLVMGFEVLNAAFDAALAREPRLVAFGEDVGKLGDVNQGFRGLQEKYGPLRVTDTGIREATILGQAIGLAMRGLRPLCEIQYLDYLLYALQLMSDDLATLLWRTKGGQKAPVIVRTRGHRLEGIWHSGSPMAGIIHLVRGMHVLVPRDMTRAAGFYNTLLKAEEPAIVVEVLNGYRLKERLPSNIGEMTVPLGVPEVVREGRDVTVVTYGACVRIALAAAEKLAAVGIEAEVIDVQSLLPFDIHGRIVESLKKTSRVLFVDEDVPGGTTAYMLREVLEVQGGYQWLDSAPRTLPGAAHRPAAGNDGDYWSKPNAEAIFDAAYEMMREAFPTKFKEIL